GWADREREVPLRVDHMFRVFSNTKLVTSSAVLMLLDEGRIALDDPIERYLPQLAEPRVLRPGAASIADTEPAARPITIRHLLSHSAGLSYGLLDPGSVMFNAYTERQILSPAKSLAQMIDALAGLPLSFHPGTAWEYSVATDVLGRLVEVVSGQRLDAFFAARVFEPLGMADTMFTLPPERHARLVAYYAGADMLDPMKPGLTRTDQAPYPGAYLRPVPKLSGGGGLVSTLGDMVALVRSLLPGGATLLKPATLAQMRTNQLPPGVHVRFPIAGEVPGKGFGLAGAVTLAPSSIDPPRSAGELQWGGIAGTHWWVAPEVDLAAVVMTQRQMSFWHPFSFEFKRLVHRAVLG
ncbi:MAG TPA: serine hydrolase domain-containing protein, partial [Burkholderiaceae bacterium]|nr:serine hydrolase domain-containing protein [Burkholderiaceae bacterium]